MPKKISYEENHKIINGILYKKCNNHKDFFPNENEWFPCTEEYFYKNKCSPDNLYPYCKKCNIKKGDDNYYLHQEQRIIQRKEHYKKYKEKEINSVLSWQQKHKEKCKQDYKMWQQNNPDKIKKYNEKYSNKKHTINIKEWESCKKYFNYACAYCGLIEEEHKKLYHQQLHKEHVNCNGEGDLSNCVPSCRKCNDSKHTEYMESWFRRQEFFTEEKLNKINKWISEDYKLYIENKNRKKVI